MRQNDKNRRDEANPIETCEVVSLGGCRYFHQRMGEIFSWWRFLKVDFGCLAVADEFVNSFVEAS